MAKEPNYGLRRGVAGTIAAGIGGGLAGAAGAAINPAQRLAAAGLSNAPQDIAEHIIGSGQIGAVGGAAIAAGYVAHRAIQNRKNRNLGRQFD